MAELPESETSFWREAYTSSTYPALTNDTQVDVAIVGGGITGLTAAYLLKQAGFSVAVLEKRTVGSGTTGRTTGKLSSQHSTIYSELQSRFGSRTAKIYGEANEAAIEHVAKIIKHENLHCDWRREDNYVFTNDSSEVKKMRDEAKAAVAAGMPASLETTTPLPFDIKAAVKFTNQATFHPQKYLLGLAKAIDGNGSCIYENSNVIGIRDGSPGRIRTTNGTVSAAHIVVATAVPSMPLIARGGYCILEYPTESYIVAGKFSGKLPGMYISPDDEHYSILPVISGGEQLLYVGGEGHISGVRLSTEKKYQKLAEYAAKHFGITEFTHRWSDRDYIAYDGLPLIGKAYPWSKNLYVASAYRKWGLTNGTVAGIIIRDLICGNNNPWANTFTPTRISPILNIPRVAMKYITRQK